MWRCESLDGLNGDGWGLFITPTTIPAVVVDGHTGQSGGAPDITLFIACHVTRPLGIGAVDRWSPLSSCGTGQSGGTPDSLVRSDFCFVHCTVVAQSTVRCSWPLLRWLTGQSGAHQTVRWIIAEWLWENPRAASSWGASAWAPDSVRCTPDSVRCATSYTNTCFCSKLWEFPNLLSLLVYVELLCTWDKWQLGKLVSPYGLWWTSNTKIDYRKWLGPFPLHRYLLLVGSQILVINPVITQKYSLQEEIRETTIIIIISYHHHKSFQSSSNQRGSQGCS
jgi:hypothetical protein